MQELSWDTGRAYGTTRYANAKRYVLKFFLQPPLARRKNPAKQWYRDCHKSGIYGLLKISCLAKLHVTIIKSEKAFMDITTSMIYFSLINLGHKQSGRTEVITAPSDHVPPCLRRSYLIIRLSSRIYLHDSLCCPLKQYTVIVVSIMLIINNDKWNTEKLDGTARRWPSSRRWKGYDN